MIWVITADARCHTDYRVPTPCAFVIYSIEPDERLLPLLVVKDVER